VRGQSVQFVGTYAISSDRSARKIAAGNRVQRMVDFRAMARRASAIAIIAVLGILSI
jgi:hypothetical protein